MRLDIVLPALNEEKRLTNTVETLSGFMSARMDDYDWRIVISDNGSTDATPDIGRRLASGGSRVHYLRLEQEGKGGGIKHAWARSDAAIVAYMDVDLATDLQFLPALIHVIVNDGYDVAIGSRQKQGSQVIGRSLQQKFIARCYNMLIRGMFRTGFIDSQCGFKAVNRGVVERVLPLVKDTGWFFDTELLILCERRGVSICELPVKWIDQRDSRVRVMSATHQVMKAMLRLFFSVTTGRQKG